MSKGYNMAGWRVGFCAGNRRNGRGPGHDQGLLRLRHVPGRSRSPRSWPCGIPKRRSRPRPPFINSAATCWCEGLRRIGWEITPPRAGMFVWAKIPEPWAQPDGHDRLRHEAAGGGRRGRQPRHRLRPGRRRYSAAGAGRKRKSASAGRAANRPLPGAGSAHERERERQPVSGQRSSVARPTQRPSNRTPSTPEPFSPGVTPSLR